MISQPIRRTIAGALLLAMAGCSTVRPVAEPRVFVTSNTPTVVWVTRTAPEPATLALEGPRIVGDTLVGFVMGDYVELPLSQIGQVSARQHSRGRTIALLAGLGLAVVGLSFVISAGGGFGDDYEEEGFRRRR